MIVCDLSDHHLDNHVTGPCENEPHLPVLLNAEKYILYRDSSPLTLYNMSRSLIKLTKWHVRPAKTEISLSIRPVWSESSLFEWRKLGSWATLWVHSKDSAQTGWMPRLIWVFAGHTCHFVGFIMRRLACILPPLRIIHHQIFSI